MRWVFSGAQTQQSSPSGGSLSNQVLALSWKIATDPKLYRELAANPYTPRSLQIISERFPDMPVADVIRAVAWAEPEGRYDWDMRQLEADPQKEALRKQYDSSVEIRRRLAQFNGTYAKHFGQLPKEFIYNDLSFVIFKTADVAEIEKRFPQHQRRDFKLSIIDVIENPVGITATNIHPFGKVRLAVIAALFIMLLIKSSVGRTMPTTTQSQQAVPHLESNRQVLGKGIKQEHKALPVRLKIPSINVDAAIQSVGVSATGEMETPSNPDDVGWFAPGPRPGEKGSAVLAGHLNREDGTDGIFASLQTLNHGDMLFIEDDTGTVTAFVVRENRIYDQGYADEVFSRNDGAYLNLITCEGAWNETTQGYDKRLVVFADIVY